MQRIYLDHNATTPMLPEVADAIDRCHRAGYGNPASPHAAGRAARRVVEDAREQLAEMLGIRLSGPGADRLIFTSGGTEANNLALRGIAGAGARRIIISAIEHPSVVGPAEQLGRDGYLVERLRVRPDGVVDPAHLRYLLEQPAALASVMLGNHETGVLQPVPELAAWCAAAGVWLHTDAVQVVGKLPVDFRQLGVAALSFSAHKFHGPVGIGALAVRHGVPLRAQLHGGFQQAALRPGSEPAALIVGMQAALASWQQQASARAARLGQLRDRLQRALGAGHAETVLLGTGPRLPHTLGVSFPGLDRQALLMALDLAGVNCSAGSACASGSSEPSPVLTAMGCPPEVVQGGLRLSLGATTTLEEVDEAARRILQVVKQLRLLKSGGDAGLPPREADSKAL